MPATETAWIQTDRQYPPPDKRIEWIDSGGQVQKGRLIGRLWFPDPGDMYTYYQPIYWRPLE